VRFEANRLPKDIVLTTTARNEVAYIGRTIESVLAQTLLNVKWVILSDGSVDRTDDIIKKVI
jgi:glycosyltransferase involved in cell wall biosynthesis